MGCEWEVMCQGRDRQQMWLLSWMIKDEPGMSDGSVGRI